MTRQNQFGDFQAIPVEASSGRCIGNTDGELLLQSTVTGPTYKVILRGPIFADDTPRPADEAELRRRFSGEYAPLSVVLNRNTVEFWIESRFFSALHCKACELEYPPEHIGIKSS
ncbi:MAG: hypothetical protein ABSB74_19055 [Tepidisphaeraceae bacterium]